MRSSFRATTLAALALTLVLVACGSDDSSGPNPSDVEAGMLVSGSFEAGDFEYETSNLLASLEHLGYSLDTTSSTDSAHIAALIGGKDIVFFPEDNPAFSAGTLAILKAFVDGGGTLVLVAGYDHLDWVNTAFGWSLASDEDLDFRAPMPKADGADHTPYRDGPSSIPGNNGGSLLDVSTLPDSGIVAYEGENGRTNASVAVLPSGSGRLVYFAWDWYDATPVGLQDGGWNKLLKLSAGF